ncbi:hypothetical protein E2P81_ATG11627 [Venturia nashicola]|nr:hypothetical protein E2P81_ATG11627 [Venturia nashicola]
MSGGAHHSSTEAVVRLPARFSTLARDRSFVVKVKRDDCFEKTDVGHSQLVKTVSLIRIGDFDGKRLVVQFFSKENN